MTKINEIFYKRDYSSVEFTKVKIKKYGKRYQSEFFSRAKGIKAEVSIGGESIENCIHKTEAFLETKLRPEEIEVCTPTRK